jgi:hypothetical protein
LLFLITPPFGVSRLFESNHVQRSFRDLQAVSGHIVANWDVAAYSCGQMALGGPTTDLFV